MKKEGVKKKIDDFRCKLGFKLHDITMSKEESVTIKIIKAFSNEKILLQHHVLNYQIDLYFPEHKLAVEVDEKGHTDRDEKKGKWKRRKRTTQQQQIILHFKNWCYKNKMKTYCVKCRKDTENIDTRMVRTKNDKIIMHSKCPVCGIKKSRFVKEQEAKGLLSNLGIKTPLSKILLLNVLF